MMKIPRVLNKPCENMVQVIEDHSGFRACLKRLQSLWNEIVGFFKGKFWYFKNELHKDLINIFFLQLFVFLYGEVTDTFSVIKEVQINCLRHRYDEN